MRRNPGQSRESKVAKCMEAHKEQTLAMQMYSKWEVKTHFKSMDIHCPFLKCRGQPHIFTTLEFLNEDQVLVITIWA